MSPVRGILLATMLGCFASLAAQEIWVNCGGEEYYDRFGRYFLPDVEYSADGGYGYQGGGLNQCPGSFPQYISEDDVGLLKNKHSGSEYEYRFDVSSGKYILTLYFCDHYGRSKESYPFDVSVEDEPLLQNFSIFDEAGRLRLIIHRHLIEINDDQLNLDFQGRNWGGSWVTAQVVALGVTPFDSLSPDPNPPTEFEIIPSYGMNALLWTHSPELTVTGYNVYRSQNGGEFEPLNSSPVRQARYYDRNAIPGASYTYYVTSADIRGGESESTESISAIPLSPKNSRLPVYYLDIDTLDLDFMYYNIWSDEYTPCTFRYQDVVCSAGIRFRGHLERAVGTKPGWKIRLPSTHPLIGFKKINLKSEVMDPSFFREPLFFLCSKTLDIPTILYRYVHLEVNGEYYGVFLEKEQIGKAFLRSFDLNDEGSLYKVISSNLTPLDDDSLYKKSYEKEAGDVENYTDLIGFIVLLNTTPQASFPAVLSQAIDLRNFASWYALNNVMANEDFYSRNYFLYKSPGEKWIFIPWDCDYTLRYVKLWESIEMFATGENAHPLYKRFLSVPSFRLAYCNRVYQILSMHFTEEILGWQIDSLYQLIEIDGKCDLWKCYGEDTVYFVSRPEGLLGRFRKRRDYLLSEAIEKSMPPRSATLRINEIASQPEAWVELINTGEEDIDLSSFKLDIDLGQSGRWGLPDTVLEPEGVTLLKEEDGTLPPLSGKGGELVVFDAAGDPVDAVFYDYITPGSSLGRKGKGSDRWTIFPDPTPGKVNPEEKCRFTVTPNLFAQSTTIRVELLQPGNYSIAIYDQVGRRVSLILREDNGTLYDKFTWEAKDDVGRPLPAGVYFLLLASSGETLGKEKVILLK